MFLANERQRKIPYDQNINTLSIRVCIECPKPIFGTEQPDSDAEESEDLENRVWQSLTYFGLEKIDIELTKTTILLLGKTFKAVSRSSSQKY